MENTRIEAVAHLLIGFLITAFGFIFNIFSMNFLSKGFFKSGAIHPFIRGAAAPDSANAVLIVGFHFSVVGFVLTFVGITMVVLAVLGFVVYSDEQTKNKIR